MTSLKATVVITEEYEVDPKNYGCGSDGVPDPESVAKVEETSIIEDLAGFVDDDATEVVSLKVVVIKDPARKMSIEDEFWAAVERINWPGLCQDEEIDFNEIREFLLKEFGEDSCKCFFGLHRRKYRALQELMRAYDKNNEAQVSDDGLWDLCAHIVGLGKEEYEAALLNPRIIVDRGRSNKYRENFGYCFPTEEKK